MAFVLDQMLSTYLSTRSAAPLPTGFSRRSLALKPSSNVRLGAASTPINFLRPSAMHAIPVQAAAEVMEEAPGAQQALPKIAFHGVHHIGILCEDLQTSLHFYRDILDDLMLWPRKRLGYLRLLDGAPYDAPGLDINPERPHDKLPYDGAWLWVGPEMIHLMVLPNPDPMEGRPEHGGRDRHACLGVGSVEPIKQRLEAAGVPFTASKSGRAAIFFRDPDQNVLECVEQQPWR